MILLVLANSIIFILLALLHIYWATGGKWARNLTIPVDRKGRKAFKPSIIGTLLVAAGLIGFAFIMIANTITFNYAEYTRIVHYSTWGIGIIFLLRSIGDFKFFGFMKRIRHTEFGLYDSKIYSPLALAIAVISFVVATWN